MESNDSYATKPLDGYEVSREKLAKLLGTGPYVAGTALATAGCLILGLIV